MTISAKGGQINTVNVDKVIKISAAIIGPLKLPNPPTITTKNAFMIMS